MTALGEIEVVNAFRIALKAYLVNRMTSLAVIRAIAMVRNRTPTTPTAFEDARSSEALTFLRIAFDVAFLAMVKFAKISCKMSSSNAASVVNT